LAHGARKAADSLLDEDAFAPSSDTNSAGFHSTAGRKSSDQRRFMLPQAHSEGSLINHQRVLIPLDCEIRHEAVIEMF
jgi:hypothetical protein